MSAEHDSSGSGSGTGVDVPVNVEDDGTADVVDFNALHAALGDLPPPPTSSTPNLGGAVTSDGKNNATYASARPHTIPPTRAPAVDPHAPSIVVADDLGPPPSSVPNMPIGTPTAPIVASAQMTIPMGSPIMSGVGAVSPGPMPVAPLGRPPSPSHPFDPRFPAQDAVQQTMHMPGRPVAPIPRRPRAPTMVVRARGPSGKKKALVFIGMLLLVVGIGLGVIIVVQPAGLNLDVILGRPAATGPANGARRAPPTPTTPAAPAPPPTSTGVPTLAPIASSPSAP